jgi:hypothetical protein
MSTLLDATIIKAQGNPDVAASVVDVLQGVAAQIDLAKKDQATVAKLSSQLRGAATAIAKAVTKNTPHAKP